MWRIVYFIELYTLMLGALALIAFTFFVEWNNWSMTERIVWIFALIFVCLVYFFILKNAKRVYDGDKNEVEKQSD